MQDKNPMVSIIVVAYNQESFIANALDGILLQEVNFKYEIIVADDSSGDATVSILQSYKQSHPDLIQLSLSNENEGPYKNGLRGYNKGAGKYITWLDADDYWEYPYKLQKQVDFLEANEDYIGCFNDARIVHEPGGTASALNQAQGDFKFYSQFNEYRSDFYPWHLLKRNIIPTASLIFRNQVNLDHILDRADNSLSLNWAIQLEIIKDSKFRYFNEPWSVYNDHPLGISKKTALNDFKIANIDILKRLLEDDYYGGLYRDIYESMAHEYLQILLNPDSQRESDQFINDIRNSYLQACERSVSVSSIPVANE
jgi:glycosyltransferase involved in cell wall biosynthesis